jgi:hypothetical protein
VILWIIPFGWPSDKREKTKLSHTKKKKMLT